jgi:hypothetical protein
LGVPLKKARISARSVKSSLDGMYMNHLCSIGESGPVPLNSQWSMAAPRHGDTHGMRCGWNHSVKIPVLMTTELVLMSLLNRPLTRTSAMSYLSRSRMAT